MAWYSKYLTVFEQPLDSIPNEIKQEIKNKIQSVHSDSPLVSVVLIAHNEETHLLSCLWSLCENKTNYPVEILVVNNNSTDSTVPLLEELGVHWFDETKKGPGFARQRGLEEARGTYHLCIDSDTIYPPEYINTHMKYLVRPDVACTYGLWSFIPTKKNPAWALAIYEGLRDMHLRLQNLKRPELNVRGMVMGFRTEYGRKIGFRTDIKRGEDGSLALAMKPLGKLCFVTSRKARVLTCNSTLDQDGSLMNSIKVRIKKALRGFTGLFTTRENYDSDDTSNIITQDNHSPKKQTPQKESNQSI